MFLYQRVAPQLDAINSFSMHGSTSRKGKYTETLRLLESTIYCATVDRQVEVLQVPAWSGTAFSGPN